MADEITVKVGADVDTSQVEELESLLAQISDTAVTIQTDTTSIAELEAEIEALQAQAEEEHELGLTAQAEETEAEIGALQAKLEELKSTTDSIDGSGIGGIGDEAENSKESVDGLLDSVEGMSSLTVGGGLAAGLASATNAAGSYEDDMKRVGMALKGVAMTSDEAEKTYGGVISRMTKSTGRGAADVRNHLITLGGAGIKSEKLLSDSFKGISAAAFQTKNPISSLDSAFTTMVQSGLIRASSLSRNFQISMSEVGKAMGMAGASSTEVSKAFKELDEGTRASVLSTALTMHYGEEGNKNYLTSFQQLTDELDRAKDAFMRLVGEALLPTVVPAIHIATDIVKGLASAFKGLPEPVQQVIGGFGGLVLGASALGLVLNGVFKIVRGAIAPFQQLYGYFTKIPDGENLTKFQQHLNKVKDTAGALKDKLSSLKTVIFEAGNTAKTAALNFLSLAKNTLLAGLNALKSVGMWIAEKVAMIASTIATTALTVAQALLNIVMSMNPVMLVVLALIALAAAIIWAYQNVDQFRQFVDQLWATIMQVFTSIRDTIAQFTSALGLEKDSWINNLLAFLIFVGTLPIQLAIIFANMIAKALGFGDNFVQNLVSSAIRAVSGFANKIRELPGIVVQEFQNILNKVGDYAKQIVDKVLGMGEDIVNAVKSKLGIGSPGYMYYMIEGEFQRIDDLTNKTRFDTGSIGEDMVSSFNSDFGSSTGGASGTGAGSMIINVNNPTVDSHDRIREIEAELASLLKEANLRRNI